MFGFHWSENLIWVYIPLAFWGLFPSQNSLGLCLYALWKSATWRQYPSSTEKSQIIIYRDYFLPASYLCLTLLFYRGALLKHFLHLKLYFISTKDVFKLCHVVSARIVKCLGTWQYWGFHWLKKVYQFLNVPVYKESALSEIFLKKSLAGICTDNKHALMDWINFLCDQNTWCAC